MKLLFILTFPILLFSQEIEIRIEKVLDANLFETDEGQKICLANVDAPSLFAEDSSWLYLAKKIKRFAKDRLEGKRFQAEFVQTDLEKNDAYAVRLTKEYTLNEICFNTIYLENGYGKYDSIPETKFAYEYQKAESDAIRDRVGIWNSENYNYQVNDYFIFSGFFSSGGQTSKNILDVPFIEGMIKTEIGDDEHLHEFQIGLLRSKVEGSSSYDAPPEYHENKFHYVNYFHIAYRVNINYKYFGYGIGLFYISGGELFEGGGMIVLPTVNIKLGYLKELYFSVDFLQDFMFAPISIGMNYNLDRPFTKVWVGVIPNSSKSETSSSSHVFGVKFDYKLFNNIMLRTQTIFSNTHNGYAFRIGLGIF